MRIGSGDDYSTKGTNAGSGITRWLALKQCLGRSSFTQIYRVTVACKAQRKPATSILLVNPVPALAQERIRALFAASVIADRRTQPQQAC
jgi:hypothetical protein